MHLTTIITYILKRLCVFAINFLLGVLSILNLKLATRDKIDLKFWNEINTYSFKALFGSFVCNFAYIKHNQYILHLLNFWLLAGLYQQLHNCCCLPDPCCKTNFKIFFFYSSLFFCFFVILGGRYNLCFKQLLDKNTKNKSDIFILNISLFIINQSNPFPNLPWSSTEFMGVLTY